MDATDQAKITHLSGQEDHGVHHCHNCGWPFPNPHPSAKHRRAHKRICGTIEGYNLVHSEGSTHSAVSDDDEHPSDDDHKSPSPKIVERSKNELGSGEIGDRSNRMEDEVFSDAVAEFSDSGISPGAEYVLKDAGESVTNMQKVPKDGLGSKLPLEDIAITDAIKPPSSLTDSKQIQNPGCPEITNDCLGGAIPSDDHVPSSSIGSMTGSVAKDLTEELTFGLSDDRNYPACNLSAIKPETLTDVPQEGYKASTGEGTMESPLKFIEKETNAINNEEKKLNGKLLDIAVSPIENTGECAMQFIEQKTNAMGNEEKDLDRKLLEIAVSPSENPSETSEAELNSEKTDEKTSVPVAAENFVQSEGDQIIAIGSKISQTSLSYDLKSVEPIDASADNAHVQVEAAQGADSASCDDLVEYCKAKKEMNENVLVLDKKLQDTAVSPSEDAMETSEAGSKLEKTDGNTLDPMATGGIIDIKEDQSGEVVCKTSPTDLFQELKSIGETDASHDVMHTKVDKAEAKGEENESVLVLVVPDDVSAVDSHKINVGDEAVKLDLPGTSNSCAFMDVEANTKEPVSKENHPSIESWQVASCSGASPSDMQDLGDKQDDVCRNPTVPVEGEVDVSEIKVGTCDDLGSVELGPMSEESGRESEKTDTILSVEQRGPHDFSNEPLEVLPPNATVVLADTMLSPTDTEVGQKTLDKVTIKKYDVAGKESMEGSIEENIAIGGDSAGSHNKVEINECEIAGKESRVGDENIMMNNPEFVSNVSESHVSAVDDMGMPLRSSTETECKYFNEVPNPSKVGINTGHSGDIIETDSNLQNQDKDSQEVCKEPELSKHNVELVQGFHAVAESNLSGDDLSQGTSENLSMEEPKIKPGKFELSVQSLTTVEENCTRLLGGESSGIRSSVNEQMLSSGDAESSVQSLAVAEDDCTRVLGMDVSGIGSSKKEPLLLSDDAKSSVQSLTAVEDDQIKAHDQSAPGIKSDSLQVEGDNNNNNNHVTERQLGVLPLDISIDSGSQTDSLEGNWGSVSVGTGISTQSDAIAAVDAETEQRINSKASTVSEKSTLQKPKPASEAHGSDKSDHFEAPSFATLVEPGHGGTGLKSASSEIQTEQHQQLPQAASSQAGWFPSLTTVVNESQGRKKNEEIIAKVTSWSTGKQHTQLKNLLVEANNENKPKSPTPKENSASLIEKDELPTKNGSTTPTKVNTLPAPEASSLTETAKQELEKEWNSPARYPMESKREKRKVKGRPYWATFVCCSSVN